MTTALRQTLSGVLTRTRRLPWAEVAAAALLLVGWALITQGLALLMTPKVWPLSAGLFCLTLFGWKFLLYIARDGLYRLTRETGDQK